MNFLVPVITALLLSVFDTSYSSFVANLFILVIGCFYASRVPDAYKKDAKKLLSIVYVIYISIAYIFSLSFLNGDYFYSGDSLEYLETFLNNKEFSISIIGLIKTFAVTKDILYIEYLYFSSYLGNTIMGGATVYYMTLLQTFFGILSIITLYGMLVERFGQVAFKYTLLFSCFSILILYSNFVVRDIIITYFYIEACRIVLKPFKKSNVAVLLLLSLMTAGIRMLSGIFLLGFAIIYVYMALQNTKYKTAALSVLVLFGICFAVYILSSDFFKTELEGMNSRQEDTAERVAESGGLFNLFSKLPIGIRQVALLLYTQITPFPPYAFFLQAETLSHFLISVIVIVCEIYWFVVSYTFILSMYLKKTYRLFDTSELFLLGMTAIFLIANCAQPDIRRMMPMYPFIFLLYIKSCKSLPSRWVSKTKGRLCLTYFVLLGIYFIIKGV